MEFQIEKWTKYRESKYKSDTISRNIGLIIKNCTEMSLFKKPKKTLQKNARIFTSEIELMDVAEEEEENPIKLKKKDKDKKDKSSKPQKSSLLSFNDEGLFVAARDNIYLFSWLMMLPILFLL